MADRLAISLRNVSKTFKLPHEKPTGIKQAIIKFRPGKKYEVQHVLENISFDIKEGEFFAIVGRNGSGKSTLLKLLAQIYVPNKGKLVVNGSLTPFIELGVGFNAELTGRENVYLNGALLGFNRKQMDLIYDDIVDFAEIERFMDQKLKNYSSGMQVRLAFSIAIRANSDILLIDEVLAVGDAAFQQKCFNYFEELKRKKRTVILVTHDMGAVRRFCTRAIYIDNGLMIHDGTPDEVAEIYLEENMESSRNAKSSEDNNKPSDDFKVNIKAGTQSAHEALLQISYQSKPPDPLYVGLSIIRDGVTVAEINSSKESALVGSGSLEYRVSTDMFNSGLYQAGIALFKISNKELVAVSKQRAQFIVKGSDDTRGAALKLGSSWIFNVKP